MQTLYEGGCREKYRDEHALDPVRHPGRTGCRLGRVMSTRIDLNADLGEGSGNDAALMAVITSCNIACGGHAGDERSMRQALQLALRHNVAAGAHPSFPDREAFGRAPSALSGQALRDALAQQIRTLKGLAGDVGVTLRHLKPHGALYNMAATDAALAMDIVQVLNTEMPGAKLVGPPRSLLQEVALASGVGFIAEGFADRAYEASGQLRSRSMEGAVLTGREAQVKQARELALQRQVTTFDGSALALRIDTICVHGDTANAVEAATFIRSSLEDHGVTICAVN